MTDTPASLPGTSPIPAHQEPTRQFSTNAPSDDNLSTAHEDELTMGPTASAAVNFIVNQSHSGTSMSDWLKVQLQKPPMADREGHHLQEGLVTTYSSSESESDNDVWLTYGSMSNAQIVNLLQAELWPLQTLETSIEQ